MPYTVKLDRSGCSGHARCAYVAPDLFPLDKEGYSVADGVVVPEGQEALALRGIRSCPERVLSLLDEYGEVVTQLSE
jgi:ferredoxin